MLRTYELSRRAGIEIEGAVTWAFLFEDQPYFDGFRDLATNGIDKAVLNAFRMLGKLGGDWLEATSSHAPRHRGRSWRDGVRGDPDVNAVATRDDKGISILVWHYHDDDVAGRPTPRSRIAVAGWPGRPRSAAPLPDGRGPLERLRRLEGDGLAAGSVAAPTTPGSKPPASSRRSSRRRSRSTAAGST